MLELLDEMKKMNERLGSIEQLLKMVVNNTNGPAVPGQMRYYFTMPDTPIITRSGTHPLNTETVVTPPRL